jgi:hypothetical protein
LVRYVDTAFVAVAEGVAGDPDEVPDALLVPGVRVTEGTGGPFVPLNEPLELLVEVPPGTLFVPVEAFVPLAEFVPPKVLVEVGELVAPDPDDVVPAAKLPGSKLKRVNCMRPWINT